MCPTLLGSNFVIIPFTVPAKNLAMAASTAPSVTPISSPVGWAGFFAHHFQAVAVFHAAIAYRGIRSAWALTACAHPTRLSSISVPKYNFNPKT